ncbi:MAG TPA: hypothetical protein PK402_02975 [Tepidisphaeraceae bacterium]|nr:hypothetical protein [Tepidisphaeraceae bacterium]
MSFKHSAIDLAKRIVRPISKHRFLIERAKYIGRDVKTAEQGNELIRQALAVGMPTACGKIGSVELGLITRYLMREKSEGQTVTNWAGHDRMINNNAGVYPIDNVVISKFARVFLESLRQTNLLGVWYRFGEARITKEFSKDATLIDSHAIEPYFFDNPWTTALKNKRVLVITPFTISVERNFANRHLIWKSKPNLLPDFQIETLRCPLQPQMIQAEYPTWHDAFEKLKSEMSRRTWDVMIVGAGAWSIPLCAHARSMGRCGIHMGGSTQILFGIKGKRWDNHPKFQGFFNEHWTRPLAEETPRAVSTVENGCYW